LPQAAFTSRLIYPKLVAQRAAVIMTSQTDGANYSARRNQSAIDVDSRLAIGRAAADQIWRTSAGRLLEKHKG
jgi:hypothetical protein